MIPFFDLKSLKMQLQNSDVVLDFLSSLRNRNVVNVSPYKSSLEDGPFQNFLQKTIEEQLEDWLNWQNISDYSQYDSSYDMESWMHNNYATAMQQGMPPGIPLRDWNDDFWHPNFRQHIIDNNIEEILLTFPEFGLAELERRIDTFLSNPLTALFIQDLQNKRKSEYFYRFANDLQDAWNGYIRNVYDLEWYWDSRFLGYGRSGRKYTLLTEKELDAIEDRVVTDAMNTIDWNAIIENIIKDPSKEYEQYVFDSVYGIENREQLVDDLKNGKLAGTEAIEIAFLIPSDVNLRDIGSWQMWNPTFESDQVIRIER